MDPITINALAQVGRLTEFDPNTGKVFSSLNLDFSSAASYIIDFSTQSQGQVFGVCRTMFVDNSSNPSEVEILVQGTDQFFIIPANSVGFYQIDATTASRISIITPGGSTDKATVTFYNYERAPVVWYSFGPFNTLKPLMTYGTMDEGDNVATEVYNRPLFIGGIDRSTGEFRGVAVDANGRLDFSSSISIGGIFGSDPMGAAPINPGVVQAVLNNAGDITYVELNAAGEFAVHDTDVLTAVQNLNTAATPPATSTRASVAAAAVDTLVIAGNANRRGVTFFNDSTAIMYLALGSAAASTIDYTAQVAAGGYYEMLGNQNYTGEVRAIWSAANGAVKVTELTA